MENKNNTPISEENLETVSGGNLGVLAGCYFTPTGNIRTVGTKVEAECASECHHLPISRCPCWNKDHCVGKWHTIDSETSELSPVSFSNHKQKKPGNSYNT